MEDQNIPFNNWENMPMRNDLKKLLSGISIASLIAAAGAVTVGCSAKIADEDAREIQHPTSGSEPISTSSWSGSAWGGNKSGAGGTDNK